MPQPNLRILIRSLRTRSYEKLEIQKFAAPLRTREEGPQNRLPSQQKLDFGDEPRREIDNRKADI